MDGPLVYSIVLLLAVLVSSLAERSILSTSVLFLAAGFLSSQQLLGLIVVEPESQAVGLLAELALFGVLFTDGMRLGWGDLRSAWKLPGRALLLGLPLTMIAMAILARLLLGLSWGGAWLLGAALSPTDPVFASALVGQEGVPRRLKHLLNVESGLNDGLALPLVVIILELAGREEPHLGMILAEVIGGIAIGVLLPLAALRLEHSRFFSASPSYRPLNAFAVGLLVLTTCWQVHANQFLGAFAAGITMATVGPEARDAFRHFGELVAELLKLAALLVFGALISPSFLGEISGAGYLFVFLVLVLVRTLGLGLSLIGSEMPWREQAVAAWFGPRGFASVVYGLMILRSALPEANDLFHLVAVTVAASIIVHSSTDVVVARYFRSLSQAPVASIDAQGSDQKPAPGNS